ncbi:RNA polymerase sigma factor [Aquimarina sp. TRL1]|uniref:RNA polymerase sigma factor n=1 Tax=Aquimarina sp. (strain TRL1) TaxID=2736252 RepID=UPI00158F2F36|nr:RNA polymerase sigma factor [Aquimarina sp. TRL1]QKX06672.1 RNA polymerase sigma factor [Aquimarina sp. TRL1]
MRKSKNKSFENIYQQHHPMVLQMCLGFAKGDRDTANDLSQEVFIRVWNNLTSFRGASSYKTWIYRITVNTCLQYVEKEKKAQTLPIPEIADRTSGMEAVTNPKISMLYNAIGQLKKVDRLIIMMVLENQDYASISEVIGISPANVRVKIHRIKKRLETTLKKQVT